MPSASNGVCGYLNVFLSPAKRNELITSGSKTKISDLHELQLSQKQKNV